MYIMNENHPLQGLISSAIEKIREMVDSETIIGETIKVDEGVYIIPVSKISFGFASGGSDIPSKSQKELFGGGSGAGVSIQPVAFISVTKGEVRLLELSGNPAGASALVSKIPDIVEKLAAMIKKDKDGAAEE